jgi:hypothetical protein
VIVLRKVGVLMGKATRYVPFFVEDSEDPLDLWDAGGILKLVGTLDSLVLPVRSLVSKNLYFLA